MRCPHCDNPVKFSGGGYCENSGSKDATIYECSRCGWAECSGFISNICPKVCKLVIGEVMEKKYN